jgi:two-component system phosphate regulon sensor histidine kinase PhoR
VLREVAQREKIELLAKNLESANKAQAETMNFITHQIRGVFTDTKAGLAAMIEGDLGPMADPVKNVVGHMLEAQNRGVGDVETFLKAVHIENGMVEYIMKPFDFKQMVIQLAEQEKARAESKKLQYEVHIGDGDYTINGDQTYLGQVISNLIDNAIRYTPTGSVKIDLARKDDKMIFSVKDSGVGVNEEDGKKLFTKYGHGKDSRRINTESNGLGLFIVKGIVDGHHGKIWYESAGTGKGTTFVVELPVAC